MLPMLEEITREYIENLISGRVHESNILEYEEAFPGTDEEASLDFLTDVSAFANANGGIILFGISETRDDLGKPTGTPDAILGIDESMDMAAAFGQLQEMATHSISPPITGLTYTAVSGFPQGKIFALRVPQSMVKPHMISLQPVFFTRGNSGNLALSYVQVKEAMIATKSFQDKIRDFRLDCVDKVLSRKTPLRMQPYPKVIIQVAPLASFKTSKEYDISAVVKDPRLLPPIDAENWEGKPNYDGFFTYAMYSEIHCGSYAQLFKNGSIETVGSHMIEVGNDDKTFPPIDLHIEKAIDDYFQLLKILGVPGPFYILISLLGIQGYRQVLEKRSGGDSRFIEKNEILVPELFVQEFPRTIRELERMLEPAFETIWKASGLSRTV